MEGEPRCVASIASEKGEKLKLDASVAMTDDLCASLRELESQIVASLRGCLPAAETDTCPSQISSLAASIAFTADVEAAIQNGTRSQLRETLHRHLCDITHVQKCDHDGLHRLKSSGQLMDAIRQLDILDDLIQKDVTDVSAWEWTKHLRYYKRVRSHTSPHGDDVRMHLLHGVFDYSWEFLAVDRRFVHTALTEKCFLVLTQAMATGFGGNPYGPAGTGKTESVKALGHALGRDVLVFNCNDAFDASSMGRIFVGLLSCGSWGCFDEFNRLVPHVLSAVAQHIHTIQAGSHSFFALLLRAARLECAKRVRTLRLWTEMSRCIRTPPFL